MMKPLYIAGLNTTPGDIRISAQDEADDLEKKGLIKKADNYFASRVGTDKLAVFENEQKYYDSLVNNVQEVLEEAGITNEEVTHIGYIGDLFEKQQLPRIHSNVVSDLGLRVHDVGIQTGCAASQSQIYNMLVHAQAPGKSFNGLILGGGVVREYLEGTNRGIFGEGSGAMVLRDEQDRGFASIYGGKTVLLGDTETFEKNEGDSLTMRGLQVARFVMDKVKSIGTKQMNELKQETGLDPTVFYNHNSNTKLQGKLGFPYRKETFPLYGNTRSISSLIEMDHSLRDLPAGTSFASMGYGEGVKISTVIGEKI